MKILNLSNILYIQKRSKKKAEKKAEEKHHCKLLTDLILTSVQLTRPTYKETNIIREEIL